MKGNLTDATFLIILVVREETVAPGKDCIYVDWMSDTYLAMESDIIVIWSEIDLQKKSQYTNNIAKCWSAFYEKTMDLSFISTKDIFCMHQTSSLNVTISN